MERSEYSLQFVHAVMRSLDQLRAHHGVDELRAILAALHNREQTLANVRNFPSRGNTSVNRKIEILKLLKGYGFEPRCKNADQSLGQTYLSLSCGSLERSCVEGTPRGQFQ